MLKVIGLTICYSSISINYNELTSRLHSNNGWQLVGATIFQKSQTFQDVSGYMAMAVYLYITTYKKNIWFIQILLYNILLYAFLQWMVFHSSLWIPLPLRQQNSFSLNHQQAISSNILPGWQRCDDWPLVIARCQFPWLEICGMLHIPTNAHAFVVKV